MSLGSVELTLNRILAAEPHSRIAVFRGSSTGLVDAVFESTKMSRLEIKRNSKSLIGIYDKNCNLPLVKLTLNRASGIEE